MFSKIMTKESMKDCLNKSDVLKQKIKTADAIIIGAGAGLSTSAGFVYDGARFSDNFKDFADKYGFENMYYGGFYPFETLEEHWAYWSRYVMINRYMTAPKPVYDDLKEIIGDKNYFVITTNVDHQFQKAGFDKNRLFYTQGDYGLFQCSVPCHNKTYDNEAVIKQMYKEQKEMKIPTELIPKCPVCKKPMTMNLRADDKFVQDDGWYVAYNRYNEFIEKYKNSNVLFIELGVGNNTPIIIKYPFWKMTLDNPLAMYACINYGEAVCPEQIENRAVCINNDIGSVFKTLK